MGWWLSQPPVCELGIEHWKEIHSALTLYNECIGMDWDCGMRLKTAQRSMASDTESARFTELRVYGKLITVDKRIRTSGRKKLMWK